jgi:choline-sulfatase
MKTIKLLALCLAFAATAAWAKAEQPNILLIITDQHTGSIMTQRGYDHIETPGIDRIADEGVTFTRAYTTYPVCTAYRASLMTGMMPSKLPDPTQFPSIGQAMAGAGYQTVYHGKWHVGSTKIGRVADWHGFEVYNGRQNDTTTRERVVEFLREDHERPFFLVTSFMNPHDTCELARLMSGIEDDWKDQPIDIDPPVEITPPLPANFAIPENEPEGFSVRRGSEPGSSMFRKHPTRYWTEEQWRQYMWGYDRLLEMVDEHIAQLMDELETQGLLDNTVIIYTSDHGTPVEPEDDVLRRIHQRAVHRVLEGQNKGGRAGPIHAVEYRAGHFPHHPALCRRAGAGVPARYRHGAGRAGRPGRRDPDGAGLRGV